MIYLLFTNRPKFANFAFEQYKKCQESAKLVVLDNSEEGTNIYTMGEYYHIPELKNNSEMFNWFKLKKEYYTDDIIIIDDDIYLNNDIIKEHQFYLDRGYDRIHYSICGLYSIKSKRYIEANWKAENTGAAISISKNIWPLGTYKGHPDGILYYYNSLPQHNIKHLPKVNIIHIIHEQNIILNEQILEKALFRGIAKEKEVPIDFDISKIINTNDQ